MISSFLISAKGISHSALESCLKMDRSANIMWSPINNTLPGNAIQKADENPVHDGKSN